MTIIDESRAREERAIAEHATAAWLGLGEVEAPEWPFYTRLAELLSRTVAVRHRAWLCWQSVEVNESPELTQQALWVIAKAIGSVENDASLLVERECGNDRCYNTRHLKLVDPSRIVMRPIAGVPVLSVRAEASAGLCDPCASIHAENFFPATGIPQRLAELEREAGKRAAADWLRDMFDVWLINRETQLKNIPERYRGEQ